MSYHSSLPDLLLQDLDLYHFLLDNPKFSHDPKATAFIDGITGRIVTRAKVAITARRFAYALVHDYGIRTDDTLVLFANNCVEYMSILLGTIAVGAVASTANAAYTASELAHQLRDTAASAVVTTPALLPIVLAVAADVGLPTRNIITVGASPHPDVRSFDSLLGPGEITPVRLSAKEVVDRTAYLVYSSGTSGLPKGVEITHRNVTSNIQQYIAFDGPLSPSAVWAAVLPLNHVYCLVSCLHTAFAQAIPLVIMPKFDFVPFLRLISRHRITFAHIAPPICLALAKHPAVPDHDISSLSSIMSAAAPLDADLARAVSARTGIAVRQAYGMSELSPLATILPRDDIVPGSVGLLIPNMHAKVLLPDGSPAPDGQPGELLLRGPNVMKGYYNNPSATADTISPDGYLCTGDVVVRDPRGHYFIVDRIKELIKYKGFQVAPAELEALLLTHPDILDAAVIGVPLKEQATEAPRAYVVRHPDSTLSEADVAAYVAERLTQHKHLRGGVIFIDAIPKTPSGKILRRSLRQSAIPPLPTPAKL